MENTHDQETIAALRKSNEELLAILAAILDLFPYSEDMLASGATHDPHCVPEFVQAQIGRLRAAVIKDEA
jgi:hypothetical protein